MKVQIVEDSGSVVFPLTELLEQEGHLVVSTTNVVGASSLLRDHAPNCLIVDSNMEPRGLKPEEICETRGGLLTGWLWLTNYVFPQDEAMKKRTVILTAYEQAFCEMVPEEERGGVKVVSKRSDQGDSYREILDFIATLQTNSE
jgi:CheY-like chemotaxis protein